MRRLLLPAMLLSALAGCGAPQAPAQQSGGGSGSVGGLNEILAAGNRSSPAARVETGPAAGPTAQVSGPATGGVDASSAADAGSAQRAAIMDAVRPAIERELRAPVEFVVQRVGVQDGWALLIANPQRPGGAPIDPNILPDADTRDGLTVNAILRFSGGSWTLVDHAIGPTDVWYCGVQGPPRSLTGC